MIDTYGGFAVSQAASRVQTLKIAGDDLGYRTWSRIFAVIKALQSDRTGDI